MNPIFYTNFKVSNNLYYSKDRNNHRTFVDYQNYSSIMHMIKNRKLTPTSGSCHDHTMVDLSIRWNPANENLEKFSCENTNYQGPQYETERPMAHAWALICQRQASDEIFGWSTFTVGSWLLHQWCHASVVFIVRLDNLVKKTSIGWKITPNTHVYNGLGNW